MTASDKHTCNSINLGYTYNHPVSEAPGDELVSWMQMQICPWFVKYGMSVKFPLTTGIEKTFWESVRGVGVPWMAKLVYTPIDVFSLSDKLLLHEVCLFIS